MGTKCRLAVKILRMLLVMCIDKNIWNYWSISILSFCILSVSIFRSAFKTCRYEIWSLFCCCWSRSDGHGILRWWGKHHILKLWAMTFEGWVWFSFITSSHSIKSRIQLSPWNWWGGLESSVSAMTRLGTCWPFSCIHSISKNTCRRGVSSSSLSELSSESWWLGATVAIVCRRAFHFWRWSFLRCCSCRPVWIKHLWVRKSR